jgi:hypothetical protein
MKKIVFFLTGLIFLASCATPKVAESTSKAPVNEEKVMKQAEIKQAVEMRRFLIKFDKLYPSNGSRIDLIPKANYIILDGARVVISAAYIGRQFSSRPIKGIDMVGEAVSFELKNNTSKGTFEIKMKVKNEMNSFDVFVTISDDGFCRASMNNYRLDHIRYEGNFIPLKPKPVKENNDINNINEEIADPVNLVI